MNNKILLLLVILFAVTMYGCSGSGVYVKIGGEPAELEDKSEYSKIRYIDYGEYQRIRFLTHYGGITGDTSYFEIVTRCKDEVVCYIYKDEGGMTCFRHQDLIEKYCPNEVKEEATVTGEFINNTS